MVWTLQRQRDCRTLRGRFVLVIVIGIDRLTLRHCLGLPLLGVLMGHVDVARLGQGLAVDPHCIGAFAPLASCRAAPQVERSLAMLFERGPASADRDMWALVGDGLPVSFGGFADGIPVGGGGEDLAIGVVGAHDVFFVLTTCISVRLLTSSSGIFTFLRESGVECGILLVPLGQPFADCLRAAVALEDASTPATLARVILGCL